jgi:hypothetical protein
MPRNAGGLAAEAEDAHAEAAEAGDAPAEGGLAAEAEDGPAEDALAEGARCYFTVLLLHSQYPRGRKLRGEIEEVGWCHHFPKAIKRHSASSDRGRRLSTSPPLSHGHTVVPLSLCA